MSFGLGKKIRWFFLLLSAVLHLLFLLLLIFIEPLTSSKYIPGSTFDKSAIKVSYLGKYAPLLSKPEKLTAPSQPKLSQIFKKEEPETPRKKITAPKKLKQKIRKEEKKKLVKAKPPKKKKKFTRKLAKIKKKKIKKKLIKPEKKPPAIPKRKLKKTEIALKKLQDQKKGKKRIKLKQIRKATRKERRKITSGKVLEQKIQKIDQRRLTRALIKTEKKKLVKKIDRPPKKIVKKKFTEPLKKTKAPVHKKAPKFPLQVKHRPEKLQEKKLAELKTISQKTEVKKKEEALPPIRIKQEVKAPIIKKPDRAEPRPDEPRKTKDKREMAVFKPARPLFIQKKDGEKLVVSSKAQELTKRSIEMPEIKQEATDFDAHAPPELADAAKELYYKTVKPKFPLGPEEKYQITETEPSRPEADKVLEQSAETVAKKDIEKERELTLVKTDQLPTKIKAAEKEKKYQTAKSLDQRKLKLEKGDIEVAQLESQVSQPEFQATSSKVEVDTFTAGGSIRELVEKAQLEQDDQYYEKLIDKSILDWLEEEMEEEEKSFALEEGTSITPKPKFTPTESEKVEIASLRKESRTSKKISLETITAAKDGKADKPGARRGKSGIGEGAYITVNLPFSNITSNPWYKITGHVVNLNTDKLYLTINGVSQVVPVIRNAFAVRLDLNQGLNKVSLLALSNINSRTAKRDVQLLYQIPKNLAKITLSLPIDGTQGLKEGDTIIVEGAVDDPSIKKAVLFFNKRPLRMRVLKGRFHKKVYMTAGRIATIRVMALTNKKIKIYSRMHTVLSGYDAEDMMNPRPY